MKTRNEVKSNDKSEWQNLRSVLESKEEKNENESNIGTEESTCSKEGITKKESLGIEEHFSCNADAITQDQLD